MKMFLSFHVTVLFLILTTKSSLSIDGSLRKVTSCTCPGQELVFECAVVGDGGTYWQGTALQNCSGGRLLVRHSQFDKGRNTTEMCGSTGSVVGLPFSRTNNSYTTQLIIFASQDLDGTTIECATDSGRNISESEIILTKTPLPPASDVSLSQVNAHQLNFNWSSVDPSCPSVHYNINASGCGECPENTPSNSFRCNITTVRTQTCVATVQTAVCNNIYGMHSEAIEISLSVPDTPSINVIPEYTDETSMLKRVFVDVHDTSGEATLTSPAPDNYTIIYADKFYGTICGSVTIPAFACDNKLCHSVFDISSSLCPPFTDIGVAVYASNVFGSGITSQVIVAYAKNHFVDVKFDFAANKYSMSCTFLQQRPLLLERSCSVDYGPKTMSHCHNDNLILRSSGISATSDTVHVQLQSGKYYETVYCYRLTATDGIDAVLITGAFTACNPNLLTGGVNIPSKVTCGASYSTLGIKKGFVCYSGTRVGSTAVYFCYDCGYNPLPQTTGSLFRTCGKQGQWNGTIPVCECDPTYFKFGIAAAVSSVIVALLVTASIAIIALYKVKAKLEQRPKQGKDSDKIYDEIDQLPLPTLSIADNVAYASCHHFVQSATSKQLSVEC